MRIEDVAFSRMGFSEYMMKSLFKNERNLNGLLRDKNNRIIGYTSITINDDGVSAYIMNIAIDPKHQGKGNVGILMRDMKRELKKQGIKYLIRDSVVENGYADKIERHYGDRIIRSKTYEHDSSWGRQRHFEIKL